jgi:hypothetical protein
MTDTEAEFALRALAIEALSVCSEIGFETVAITAIPADSNHADDTDYWHVSWRKDGQDLSVSCSYEGDGND